MVLFIIRKYKTVTGKILTPQYIILGTNNNNNKIFKELFQSFASSMKRSLPGKLRVV